MNTELFLGLAALLGVALGFALPSDIEPGTYTRPTEAEFEKLLRLKGLDK